MPQSTMSHRKYMASCPTTTSCRQASAYWVSPISRGVHRLTSATDAWHTIIAEAVHYSESADPGLREQIGLDDLPSPQQ